MTQDGNAVPFCVAIYLGREWSMGISVVSCAYRHVSDIDGDSRADATELTGLSNACIAQATSALEIDTGGYGDLQRGTVANLLTGMQGTHRSLSTPRDTARQAL